jgi:hypothetical protein
MMEAMMPASNGQTDEFEKLETRLLALGGETVLAGPEPPPGVLLARGRAYEAKGRKGARGRRHRRRQIAALRYAGHHALARPGTCEIVTGYGLGRDGWWFSHSWLWDGGRVVGTNADPVLYFGVLLTPAEASAFVLASLMPMLPGYLEASRRGAGR